MWKGQDRRQAIADRAAELRTTLADDFLIALRSRDPASQTVRVVGYRLRDGSPKIRRVEVADQIVSALMDQETLTRLIAASAENAGRNEFTLYELAAAQWHANANAVGIAEWEIAQEEIENDGQ